MRDYDVSRDYGYIKIPIPFIRLLLVKPSEAEHVIRYVIYRMSLNVDTATINIFRQIIYVFYRTHELKTSSNGSDSITLRPGCHFPTEISHEMISLWEKGKLELDFDKNGFGADGEFLDNSDSDNSFTLSTLDLYASNNDSFYSACKRWYQISQICKLVALKMEDLSVYTTAFQRYAQYNISEEVYAFIKTDIIKKYATRAKSGLIPEHERVQFACYAGIKSIIGHNDYYTANKELILARMMGLKCSSEITPDFLKRKERTEANKIYYKYSQRRQFEKLLNDMLLYGYIKCCFCKTKAGYCISTKFNEDYVMGMELKKDIQKKAACTRVQNASKKYAQMIQKAKENMT